ncbi:hypothetical protein [Burkholderia cepacia]|uniref:hypothetical protein n=1 Tax=Burkholderia cepacia TaxID=292 RepID=UPI003D67FC3B
MTDTTSQKERIDFLHGKLTAIEVLLYGALATLPPDKLEVLRELAEKIGDQGLNSFASDSAIDGYHSTIRQVLDRAIASYRIPAKSQRATDESQNRD